MRANLRNTSDQRLVAEIWGEVTKRRAKGAFPLHAASAKEAALKSALLTRLKSRENPRPITAEEALYLWYYGNADEDNRLAPKSKLMLSWLCVLASGQDLAPLWYDISEIGRRFKWPDEQTRQHAEEAAAAGFVELDAGAMILTDPRARKAA